MRVLIVEDDRELAGLLQDSLRAHRIDPTTAAAFAEGLERALAAAFDVVILDVRLPGGFRVVTDRMDEVETVSLGVWVDVGTRHEPAAINGVAHLLEHMAFKGTERRSARAIAEEIEAVGGHLNAYTSRESTAYYAKVLKEDVALALDILSDILQHSTFDPEELERERTVILQEIGQANDTPDDIIFDHFQECAYPEQAMGRPVLGRPEIIRELRRDAVVAYLRDHYGAHRMVRAAAIDGLA